ncbi:universal stress protein [Winogradskyella vincentii]|uniref:Universal stress protein n=1 Tax=Winogradskyella vincentii TaxID=2877122 RepID=A0ABS7Y2I0_9FLAO|nr:universal stress protein [Winogradskyella vincentii]MCA0154117.1 universal stress protein [Winogradskyella vincentii]
MKSVLLPTDFSENSWNAIEYALEFLKREPCVFYLLHVNTMSNAILNDPTYISTEDVIEEVYVKPSKVKLHKLLKRISKISDKDYHRFYSIVDYGFFIDSIRRQIEEKNIDLIVMGTKGASGLKKIVIGSNAGDVVVKVKCTTLVVPENAVYDGISEVAFPTDFSSHNNFETLKPLVDLVEERDSKLSVLHVNGSNQSLNEEQENGKEFIKDLFGEYEHKFFFLSNKKLEDAVQCFTESREVDMIAMVAKNLNYFQQILFHSRVENITYHTNIPFLVLHETTN